MLILKLDDQVGSLKIIQTIIVILNTDWRCHYETFFTRASICI
jgi:hypothetical protein